MLSLGRSRLRASIDPLGATLRSLTFDDNGTPVELVATGAGMPYGGAVCGRYANRIAGARFVLDGTPHRLDANEGVNQLHGGPVGFDKREWRIARSATGSARLELISSGGDQGFPGEMHASVMYTIDEDALRIDYEARASAPTVVNLTNHSYFNVSGGTIASTEQELQIFASAYTPVDDALIPTGEIAPVDGTRYDFRASKIVGETLYDTNWALDVAGSGLHPAARLRCAQSGRTLEISTSEPGLQVYSGNARGIALETQHFPDSPNRPQFPSTKLVPGETFRSSTLYRIVHT